jgi:hypothetical protein
MEIITVTTPHIAIFRKPLANDVNMVPPLSHCTKIAAKVIPFGGSAGVASRSDWQSQILAWR